MLDIVFSRSVENTILYSSLCKNKNDVLCFDNDLSYGDISGDALGENRIIDLKIKFSSFKDDLDYLIEGVIKSKKNLEKLISKVTQDEKVRIWYSEQPFEYCGLCRLASMIINKVSDLTEIFVVKLPKIVKKDNSILNYTGWGEVSSEDFADFLKYQKKLDRMDLKILSFEWAELSANNSPLRALVNGKMRSVSESFYDYYIDKELENFDCEFRECYLIGSLIGKYQLGISEHWFAYRIEKKIEQNKLFVINDSDERYRRLLAKKC